MPIPTAYDFLTRTFAAHETEALRARLQEAGAVVSKKEGEALGLNADLFARYYRTERQAGRSVSASELLAYAEKVFASQADRLAKSLEEGPGLSGFKLSKEVADNWRAFVAKENLFKYAELAGAHKAAVLRDARRELDQIPVRPDEAAVSRTQIDDRTKLPSSIRSYIDAVESKHYVSTDPARTPPTSHEIFRVSLRRANEVKIDGVTAGYVLHFDHGNPVALHIDGSEVHGGLGLYQIDPGDAAAFADLTAQQKIDLLLGGELPYDSSRDWQLPVSDVLAALGSSLDAPSIQREVDGALDFVAQTLDNDIYYAANVSLRRLGITVDREFLSRFDSYEALVDHVVERTREVHGDEEAEQVADALGNGFADVRNPEVEVFSDGGRPVGAVFTWSVSVDGDHDYWTKLFYDHTTNRFIGGATGGYETDTDTWINE